MVSRDSGSGPSIGVACEPVGGRRQQPTSECPPLCAQCLRGEGECQGDSGIDDGACRHPKRATRRVGTSPTHFRERSDGDEDGEMSSTSVPRNASATEVCLTRRVMERACDRGTHPAAETRGKSCGITFLRAPVSLDQSHVRHLVFHSAAAVVAQPIVHLSCLMQGS